jgi:CHASE3 domain sensor protein
VETGSRGFAETGSLPFLDPYESGRLAMVEDLRQLHLLIVDPVQAQRLTTLEGRAQIAIEAAQEIVADRRRGGKVPVIALFERGKRTMDAARGAVADMESSEKSILEQRTQRSRASRRFNILVIVLGSLLGMVFLSFAGAMVKREISISTRVRGQLQALNRELERRVAERNRALRPIRKHSDNLQNKNTRSTSMPSWPSPTSRARLLT